MLPGKQHLQLICDEVNTKGVDLLVGKSERGEVLIRYDGVVQDYSWLVGGERQEAFDQDKVDKIILKMLESKHGNK